MTSALRLALNDVTVERDGVRILDAITLDLAEPRIAVLGANGSGKSTLVRLLNGLILPTSGEVFVGDQTTAQDARRIRTRVGFVFQNPDNQIILPTVREDLAFGLKNLGVAKPDVATRVSDTLDRLNIEHLASREIHTLSGGEKQLVALAGVLVMQPSIVALDEPTTMLDLRNRRLLARHLASLDERIILVTHDLEFIRDYDRALVVEGGRIAFDGAADAAVEYYEASAVQ